MILHFVFLEFIPDDNHGFKKFVALFIPPFAIGKIPFRIKVKCLEVFVRELGYLSERTAEYPLPIHEKRNNAIFRMPALFFQLVVTRAAIELPFPLQEDLDCQD